MKKFINEKDDFIIDSLKGFARAHEDTVDLNLDPIFLTRKEINPKKVLLVTECTMSDNVQVDNPNVQFIKPCNLCPHMNKITLNKIYDCLKNENNEIKIGHNIAEMARKSVLKMAEIGR